MDWRDLPPLAALRAFAAYAQTQSIASAGDALGVSHAAISQQLRALETHVGVALLDRSARSMTLTPEGAALAKIVDAQLTEIERLTNQAQETALTDHARLRAQFQTALARLGDELGDLDDGAVGFVADFHRRQCLAGLAASNGS